MSFDYHSWTPLNMEVYFTDRCSFVEEWKQCYFLVWWSITELKP